MKRITVFNFTGHKINPDHLPFCDGYNEISCDHLVYDYVQKDMWLTTIRGFLDEMWKMPDWSILDDIHIELSVGNEKVFYAVMLLVTALNELGCQITIWLEYSIIHGIFVDLSHYRGEGTDIKMTMNYKALRAVNEHSN